MKIYNNMVSTIRYELDSDRLVKFSSNQKGFIHPNYNHTN